METPYFILFNWQIPNKSYKLKTINKNSLLLNSKSSIWQHLYMKIENRLNLLTHLEAYKLR